MPDPILIDCGGSTRIKQILRTGAGDLRRLLDVHDLSGLGILAGTGPLPPGATGSQEQVNITAGPPFANMIIMFQDTSGTPFTINVMPLPASFLITSNSGQNVRGDFIGGNSGLIITVFSTLTDPIVAAKQLRTDTTKRLRRRYVVDNAGPIKTIMINDAPPLVYDSSNTDPLPPAVPPPPIAPGAVGPGGAVPAGGLPFYVSVLIS